MNLLVAPFVNALFGFYYLTGSLGWSVVVVTVLVKLVLLPLVLPSLKASKKMRDLQPKLKKLQEKHKGDKTKLATAQMDLYKQEGINPMSGCLPQILQIGVLLIFFSAFNQVINFSSGNGTVEKLNSYLIPAFKVASDFKFDPYFLGTDLSNTPSKIFGTGNWQLMVVPILFLLGSAVTQYWSAKLMMPASAKASAGKPGSDKVDPYAYTKETPEKGDDMMAAMRTQSLYLMPAMTIFIGWGFSLGLLLYWFVNSLVTVGQQLVIDRMTNEKK